MIIQLLDYSGDEVDTVDYPGNVCPGIIKHKQHYYITYTRFGYSSESYTLGQEATLWSSN